MTRDDLLHELRVVIEDVAGPPYAFEDSRLLRWLADGEDRFCEQTGFFTDMTSYELTTEEGVMRYAIPSDRIIEVMDIFEGDHRLTRIVEADRRPLSYNPLDAQFRHPMRWQTDRETGFITLREPPLGGLTLSLRVHRRAATRLDAMGLSDPDDNTSPIVYTTAASTIPEQCQRGLIDYAASQAFLDHDREKLEPLKAKDHLMMFNAMVERGRDLYDRLNGASPRMMPSPQYIV